METQDGDTVFVDHVGIDFAIILEAGYGFTPAGHAEGGTVKPAIVVFQRCAVTAGFFYLAVAPGEAAIQILDIPSKAIRRHAHAAPVFDMVATREIEFFIIAPPGV